jgi:hypothetical protein
MERIKWSYNHLETMRLQGNKADWASGVPPHSLAEGAFLFSPKGGFSYRYLGRNSLYGSCIQENVTPCFQPPFVTWRSVSKERSKWLRDNEEASISPALVIWEEALCRSLLACGFAHTPAVLAQGTTFNNPMQIGPPDQENPCLNINAVPKADVNVQNQSWMWSRHVDHLLAPFSVVIQILCYVDRPPKQKVHPSWHLWIELACVENETDSG